MKKSLLYILIASATMLDACSTIHPPPECQGPVHKVNAPDVSISDVKCEEGASA